MFIGLHQIPELIVAHLSCPTCKLSNQASTFLVTIDFGLYAPGPINTGVETKKLNHHICDASLSLFLQFAEPHRRQSLQSVCRHLTKLSERPARPLIGPNPVQ